MAQNGDSYTVRLKEPHLMWGTKRYTNSRKRIYGEGYLPIPAPYARKYNIFNSNHSKTGIGYNEFYTSSADNFFTGILKSSGCSEAGKIYAKNLHGSGDLKALGSWFEQVNADVGDYVEVKWTSPTNILLTHIPNNSNYD
ncbi:MAG: hypothetical protein E7214_00495 [Clostridium sp.]|nr:hypothetical protein [Clostridium sp.]